MTPRKPTTKSDITSMPAQEIPNEMIRAIWVSFTLEKITEGQETAKLEQAKYQGTLDRRLDDIDRKLDEIPEKYETKMEVEKKIGAVRKEVNDRIDPISTNITWALRAAGVVVIGALVTWLLSGGARVLQ